jgi:hypothetical protein
MTIDQPPVTDAEGARTGNDHRYFRKSPWASSDILMMLMYGLTPEQRGLQLSRLAGFCFNASPLITMKKKPPLNWN